jgi:hypothetical protein
MHLHEIFELIKELHEEDVHKKIQFFEGLNERALLNANLAITISNHLKLKRIIMNLEDILAKVQAQKTVEDSIVTLLNETNSELKAAIASGDQSKLQQISDTLDANTKELSDAVVANTPAAAALPAEASSTGS